MFCEGEVGLMVDVGPLLYRGSVGLSLEKPQKDTGPDPIPKNFINPGHR
jgi:hypothetical protein